MKWFEGEIKEAIATSKSREAIFVVFIEGKDDTSIQFARAIDAADVSARLEQEHFVAVRLESGSRTYRFFAQIYHLVPVPSLFFIGEDGTPLEVVAKTTTALELLTKIDSVLVKAGKVPKNVSAQLIDAEQKAAASGQTNNVDTVSPTAVKCEDIINAEAGSSTKESEVTSTSDSKKSKTDPTEEVTVNTEKTEEASVTDTQPEEAIITKAEEPVSTGTEKNETSQSTELTPEEKVERARQLIEIQKKQRLEEEEKKEREKELERRRVGRDVQKMRRRLQDLEVKQAHEERIREKAAVAAAREKVRQQIALDKLERKQKELAFQELQQVQQKQQNPEQAKLCAAPSASDATVTRIQFRLPSGNPHMGQFEPTSTLGALRSYVVQNIDLPFRQFSMSTSFPRRDLTHEDDQKTLLDLELVPTAVILILPLKHLNPTTTVTPAQDGNFFSRFMWSLFAPVIGVYNYIVSYFTGGTHRNTHQPERNDEATETVNNSETIASSNIRQMTTNPGALTRYLNNLGGTTIRAEGNIHRLHSAGDDNDENNTWNGNSTEQM